MAAALRPDKTLSWPSGGGGRGSPGTPLMTLPAGQQFSKAISALCVLTDQAAAAAGLCPSSLTRLP